MDLDEQSAYKDGQHVTTRSSPNRGLSGGPRNARYRAGRLFWRRGLILDKPTAVLLASTSPASVLNAWLRAVGVAVLGVIYHHATKNPHQATLH